MRLAILPLSGLVAVGLAAASGETPTAGEPLRLAAAQITDSGIDPVITGHRVTEAERRAFKEREAKYLACGLCGEMQPFPGDLPD